MKPPYRADHVGSLLRPAKLAAARKSWKQGALDALRLRTIKDEAVLEAMRRREAIGLQAATDGEFRRDWWHLDFPSQLDGVTSRDNPGPKFGGTGEQPPIATVTGKVGCSRPVMVERFSFLKSVAKATPKFTPPPRLPCCTREGAATRSRRRRIPRSTDSGTTSRPRIARRSGIAGQA